MEAKLIKTDGSVVDVRPKDGKYFSYDELKGFVGGYVELCNIGNPQKLMIVNEEGKLIGLPKNTVATEIWRNTWPIDKFPFNNDELIVGDALICDSDLLEE